MRILQSCLAVVAALTFSGMAMAHPNHTSAVPQSLPWHYLHPDHSSAALLAAVVLVGGLILLNHRRRQPAGNLIPIHRNKTDRH